MLRRIPTDVKLTTNELPPYDTNGRHKPFVGRIPVHTPICIKACMEISRIIPNASKTAKSSFASLAFKMILKPRITKTTKSKIITVAPINPNSSAIMEKIKSLYEEGRKNNFCFEAPIPLPKILPDPIAIIDCISWKPAP